MLKIKPMALELFEMFLIGIFVEHLSKMWDFLFNFYYYQVQSLDLSILINLCKFL